MKDERTVAGRQEVVANPPCREQRAWCQRQCRQDSTERKAPKSLVLLATEVECKVENFGCLDLKFACN